MTRNELHQLVDDLADDQVDLAAELLDAYRKGDRALVRLLTAPVVPAEPDELAALSQLTDGTSSTLQAPKTCVADSASRDPAARHLYAPCRARPY